MKEKGNLPLCRAVAVTLDTADVLLLGANADTTFKKATSYNDNVKIIAYNIRLKLSGRIVTLMYTRIVGTRIIKYDSELTHSHVSSKILAC